MRLVDADALKEELCRLLRRNATEMVGVVDAASAACTPENVKDGAETELGDKTLRANVRELKRIICQQQMEIAELQMKIAELRAGTELAGLCDGCPAPAEAKRLRACGNCGNADWTELYPLCLACDSEGSPSLQPWSSCAYSPSRWKEREP